MAKIKIFDVHTLTTNFSVKFRILVVHLHFLSHTVGPYDVICNLQGRNRTCAWEERSSKGQPLTPNLSVNCLCKQKSKHVNFR